MKGLVSVFVLMFIVQGASAQYNPQKFGKGINVVGKDSTFTMRFGIRFQSLMSANWDASYLSAEAESQSRFFRHRINLSKNIGPFKLGYKDDHERNIYSGDTNLVNPSYEFFDYQFLNYH